MIALDLMKLRSSHLDYDYLAHNASGMGVA